MNKKILIALLTISGESSASESFILHCEDSSIDTELSTAFIVEKTYNEMTISKVANPIYKGNLLDISHQLGSLLVGSGTVEKPVNNGETTSYHYKNIQSFEKLTVENTELESNRYLAWHSSATIQDNKLIATSSTNYKCSSHEFHGITN